MSDKIRLTPETENRLPDLQGGGERVRFCPKCGREIPIDRQLCVYCEGESASPVRPKRPLRGKILLLLVLILVLLLLALPAFLTGANRPVPTPTEILSEGTEVVVEIVRSEE